MKRCIVLWGTILLLGCQSSETEVSSVTGQQVKPKMTTTPSLEWAQDYDRALAAAKETKRIVMVDVYTDWCGWCKKLDRDTYSNKEVEAKLAKEFVAVKINPEKSAQNAALARQFGTRGYPHIVFLDADSKKLSEISGYLPAGEFLKRLDEVAETAQKK